MRNAVAPQDPGGEQLVVSRERRTGVVQAVAAACGEGAQRPKAVVDPVQARSDVEPAERAVPGSEGVERVVRVSSSQVAPSMRARDNALLVEVDRPTISASRTTPG